MSDVFISYARVDEKFVNRLKKNFSEVGIDVWIDSEDILPAEEWRPAVQAGIEGSSTFVYVISPNSVNSDECLKELQLALDNNKRLIPIEYRATDHGTIPPSLSDLNWILFTVVISLENLEIL